MQRLMPILVGLLVVLAVLSSCVFVVRERDYALVFSLGEVRQVISEPGLYFKAPPPFQNVVTLDKRILTIESSDAERIQTSEKKNLLIDSYVKWRIADPRLYYVTFGGNERAAQERLQAQIRDALNAAVNVRTVKDVVSAERDKVMAEILTNVVKRAEPLGVQVVDVRLRRIEFAPEISESVYRRMEAERTRVANELRSIGAAESEKIRAEADRQREVIVAQAYARAQGIMGEGDAQAGSIYAQAFGRNTEFYTYYKSLEAYRAAFGKTGDVLVVDPTSEFFQFFKNPGKGAAGAPAPAN
ncbi:inner membrane-anchored protein [Bordetella pertussis]|uniref:Protein HflC n=4 Tax=Bordetella pertussis TaxID=520 RepID=Q7VWL9_BORPE|nr:protease modulator HflC [Bordetella pertussis]ETH40183.1 HflC-like protein [Bordetella pertussis H918]ETH42532.1 HflC-like protein [Bordetella pertussis H939]ETH45463.1 HflC-like protein [Bordetella pertussis H921]ETH71462.1 HflC-like protein [Bordetella pertussis STO1-CHLA-0011]ETH81794.1 HflC-like protein [Bordetella pertussis STO1-CHOC-0017]ETH85766.1 HflC-like protein [Bordetella pertussis STO1-CHOC-0018]ETH89307.1 HflC-like protein [Bordetella pertussis STO1-CHOC-0019]ETH97608.1 Hfl